MKLNKATTILISTFAASRSSAAFGFSISGNKGFVVPVKRNNAESLHYISKAEQQHVLYMSNNNEDFDDWYADFDPSQFDDVDDGRNNNYNDNQYRGNNSYDNGYSGRNSRRGGGGGRGRGWGYTRDTSRDNSNVDVAVIEDMIRERSEAKRNRDYDTADAIREELIKEYHVGIDDRERTWRSGVSLSGSGRGNFRNNRGGGRDRRGGDNRRPRQDFGPNGHDYELTTDVGPNASGFSEEELHGMIAERLIAKLNRDFTTADKIQNDLVARGVFVHDGIKEWRWDGVPYGNFSEGRNDRNPSKTIGSRSHNEIAYQKSSFSDDVEDLDDEMINKLVAERLKYKLSREFNKADSIRENLRSRYNVLIDDRIRMWSVNGDFGEEHNSRRELAHQVATRKYVQSCNTRISNEDESYIQELLDERSTAKRNRDFQTADEIRDDLLQNYNVLIDDKSKQWSVVQTRRMNRIRNGREEVRYTQKGGSNLSPDAVEEINNLITERFKYKKARNFNAADDIRDDLLERYDVRIDDEVREWRIDSNEYFPTDTGSLSSDDIEFINQKLRERFQYKRERKYDVADTMRDELCEQFGILIDDRDKEWSALPSIEEDKEEFSNEILDSEDNVSNESFEEEPFPEEEEEEENNDSTDELGEEELSKLTVVVLKEKLREAGLPVSGKKAELVSRLLSR